MTLYVFTVEEKLNEVEFLIRKRRDHRHERGAMILKALAMDLRGRMTGVPSEIIADLDLRMAAVKQSWANGYGYDATMLRRLGDGVVGRWPLIRQALERYAAEIEAKEKVDAS
jgi:hypothetical protein